MLPLYTDRVLTDSREVWRSYDRVVGIPAPALRHLLPDFLIIGAPKAGTSWLFSVLATHPEIFIPVEKELQYFNKNWRWMPIDDYLRHFEPGAGRQKGEATTSYCRLPSVAIETIKRLKPDIKLLFLVRDPVEQAWSQMKHMFRYRNANFWRYQCLFENLTPSNYVENFLDDLALSCVDHYDILRRWMRIFPPENFWLASLEEIGADPEAVYRSAAAFLGLSPPPSISQAPLQDRINEGLSYRLSAETATVLRTLHQPRALRFLDYARQEFGKDFSGLWRRTLAGETLSAPFPVADDFYGWRVVMFGGKLWAYPTDAGGKIVVTQSEIQSVDPGTPVHAADFNYELQRKLGVIDGHLARGGPPGRDHDLEDARLERAASGLPMLTITFVVDEIEEIGDYFAARMIACSESSAVERTEAEGSASRVSGAEIANSVPVYVGMRKDMWPPQPWMAPMLERNGMPPVIFVANDPESLRRKLAPFVRSTSEPIIEESYRGYNIIRLRHDMIAVKQSLGAVDLGRPLEQLTRQFDADDFMTDTDLGALRVRIAEAAGRRNTRAIFGELKTQIERMKEEQNASVEQLRRQIAAVQESLTGAIENAPGRRAMRVIRRLFGWGASHKASQDVRASADESATGGP